MRQQLEAMLAAGNETALLRFSLGEICFQAGEAEAAAEHLGRAVALDPDYSAAWKLQGQALADCGRPADAETAFARGIEVAERQGDNQAAKEMRVFQKRLGNNTG